jgi:CBS domain-containing protein
MNKEVSKEVNEEVSMNILEMCDPEAASVPVEATAERAIKTMLDRHVGAVAVIDENHRVAGIFTERDVLRRFSLGERDPRKTSIREVMTTPVEMATRATTAAEALATMVERHYRHLPIVDDDGRLLGMLSIRHVLEAKIDTLTRQLDHARSVVL